MAAVPSTRVDVWELRCRFNRGRYWDRLKANELTSRTREKAADPKYNLGPGGLSQEVYYIDPHTGVQIARVHQLLKADMSLGGGRKPDPKELLIGGVLYHLHGGSTPADKIKRDPSLRYPEGGMRCLLYKRWRWVKCKLIGR
jgi:hypothetical protein